MTTPEQREWDEAVQRAVDAGIGRITAVMAVEAIKGKRPLDRIPELHIAGFVEGIAYRGGRYATLTCLQDNESTVDIPVHSFAQAADWMATVRRILG